MTFNTHFGGYVGQDWKFNFDQDSGSAGNVIWHDKYASNYKVKDKDDPLYNEDKNPFNTSFNTVNPPCDNCPVRLTCPEECKQFRIYANKGKEVDHPFV